MVTGICEQAGGTVQAAMILINALLAAATVAYLMYVVRRGGVRVYVHLYALGIALYVASVFFLAAVGALPDEAISPIMRPLWSVVMVYLILHIATDRRRR